MATQSYIIEMERKIIDDTITADEVVDLVEAWYSELERNGGYRPYHENRDCWGTLYCNAITKGRPAVRATIGGALKGEFA